MERIVIWQLGFASDRRVLFLDHLHNYNEQKLSNNLFNFKMLLQTVQVGK